MGIKRSLIYYVMFTIALAAISIALPVFLPDLHLLAGNYWVVFWFLAGITFVAFALALIGIKSNPETGIMFIMISITVKMLFSMGFILIYSLKRPMKDMVFVIDFFILYLLLTGFEIYGLLINLRHQNKK